MALNLPFILNSLQEARAGFREVFRMFRLLVALTDVVLSITHAGAIITSEAYTPYKYIQNIPISHYADLVLVLLIWRTPMPTNSVAVQSLQYVYIISHSYQALNLDSLQLQEWHFIRLVAFSTLLICSKVNCNASGLSLGFFLHDRSWRECLKKV